jgi:hypothetical protein
MKNPLSMSEIKVIKEKAEMQLLQLPGVNGIDIGPKITKGVVTSELAIRVYVDKKHDVPAAETIPEQIDGVPTDVIERQYELH